MTEQLPPSHLTFPPHFVIPLFGAIPIPLAPLCAEVLIQLILDDGCLFLELSHPLIRHDVLLIAGEKVNCGGFEVLFAIVVYAMDVRWLRVRGIGG